MWAYLTTDRLSNNGLTGFKPLGTVNRMHVHTSQRKTRPLFCDVKWSWWKDDVSPTADSGNTGQACLVNGQNAPLKDPSEDGL
jgi:hypothetical protein